MLFRDYLVLKPFTLLTQIRPCLLTQGGGLHTMLVVLLCLKQQNGGNEV